MATLSFSVEYDMSVPVVWFGTPTTNNASTLTLETSSHSTVYSSSDDSLHYKGSSLLPSSGTVSEISLYENHVLQYHYTDGHFSISKILFYLKTLNALGLERYLLSGGDIINGSEHSDTLLGWKGNDTIQGGIGSDVLDGGAGIDTVSYALSSLGVNVTLNGKLPATVSGGDAAGDIVTNFENITGSAHADTLAGDNAANTLDGGAGADSLSGGDGNDTYFIEDTGDQITEGTGRKSGIDLVKSSLSDYSLGTNLENLILTGNSNINGSGNELNNTLIGNSGNNTLMGGDGNDSLIGGEGNDSLDGGNGKDTLQGGKGDDTYTADLLKQGALAKLEDRVIEKAGEGIDTLKLRTAGDLGLTKAVTLKLGSNIDNLNAGDTASNWLNLTGNNLNNILTGNAAANVLDGGKGADELSGGAGADIYVIDNIGDQVHEVAASDIDLVKIKIATANGSYTLGDFIENAVLTSSVAFNLKGNGLVNSLIGNAKNNMIEGGAGGDYLDGGAGSDTVSYAGSAGGVTVYLKGKLQADVSGFDADEDIVKNFESITGSSFIDALYGDTGNNTLDGGAGADQMKGGDGNDTYVVDDEGDVIVEYAGAKSGKDTVISSINYELESGSNLENLTLKAGAGSIDGTGNELDNIIIGNESDNILDGGDGKDTLKGGAGNDTYLLELIKSGSNAVFRDSFVELAGEGNSDRLILQASGDLGLTSSATLSLADNIEILDASATGSNLLNLNGNSGDNTLIGNDADNVLDGRGGKDVLEGGNGNDTYIIDSFDDSIVEAGLSDIDLVKIDIADTGNHYTLGDTLENAMLISRVDFDLFGNASDNVLTGNARNNLIWGGAGADTLIGGNGIDTLSYVDSWEGVSIVLNGKDFSVGVGGDAEGDNFKEFENVIGSDFTDSLTGDSGDNQLDGGGEADVMRGGKGNDTYVVDNELDQVIEEANGGTDLVQASITYDLGPYANLENLTLTGTADIDGTGNDLGNLLTGNAGINVLIGGLGDDILRGGAGNDALDGGDGNDFLDGGAGVDRLIGGKGDDSYSVDLISSSGQIVMADSVSEQSNQGNDTLILYNDRNLSSNGAVNLTLDTNFESMDAAQTTLAQLNLLGNESANILTGNAGSNILKGFAGNDSLKGGDGTDTLEGGADNDTLNGGDGSDLLTGGTGADVFVFDAATSKQNQDHITDFSLGDGDRINLKQSLFTSAGKTGKLSSAEFSAIKSPSTASSQHILYDSDSGELWYNSDGTGSAELILIGTLDNHIALNSQYIYLI